MASGIFTQHISIAPDNFLQISWLGGQSN